MAKNIDQVYTANPITSNASTDLIYFGQSPYGAGDDAAMLYSNFALQFSGPSPLTTKGDLYSFSTVNARLAVGATNGQIVQVASAAATGLAWSTATYPATTTVNQLLYSSSANVIAGLATANSATLITSSGGVPSLSQTLPSAVQTNITALGNQSQALNMGGFAINNMATPSAATDAATKAYADSIAAGLNPIDGVYAASTANLTGYVYNNGTVGVGATLTAGSTGAFTLDGVSPAVGVRILYKNDTTYSGVANGIYTVTTSSGGSDAVLTRATDYNTPTQIQSGDLISVEAGTANAGSSWYQTATIVAVGTTPLAFSVFFSPATYLAKANNLSDVASAATSVSNLGLGTPTGTGNVVLQTSPTLITPALGTPASGNLVNCTGYTGSGTVNSGTAGQISYYAANGNTLSGLSPNYGISPSCGAYSQSSGGPTAITNLSVTITTSGNPVIIFLQSDGTSNNALIATSTISGYNELFFFRDATQISQSELSTVNATYPPGWFQFLDTPPAGTHTFTMKATVASDSLNIYYCSLVAYELR